MCQQLTAVALVYGAALVSVAPAQVSATITHLRASAGLNRSEGDSTRTGNGVGWWQWSGQLQDAIRQEVLKDVKKLKDNFLRKEHVTGATDLQSVEDRMQWWQTAGVAKPPLDKYVLFTADTGGPNNIRIGWEMTGLVALFTDRTLVLPPASPMYLLDFGPRTLLPSATKGADGNMDLESTKTRVEDMINLKQLKASLSTLTWEEFTNRTGLTWEDAMKEAGQVPEDTDICTIPSYEKITQRILYMPGDGRREGFSCGEWFKLGGPRDALREQMQAAHWALLTHGFVWHQDAFDIAAHVVQELGLFQYNAIHARFNDFQFHEDQSTGEEILGRWSPLFEAGKKLYVASDEPEKVARLRGLTNVSVVMFKDALSGVLKTIKPNYSAERWFKLMGPVEELICTYAKVFVGTKQSSFSGHIARMRVHAQAPEIQQLILKDDPNLDEISADIDKWEKQEFVRKSDANGDVFLYLPDVVDNGNFF